MACVIAGVFFLRYWKITRERLFAYFAAAFAMLAVNYLALAAAVDSAFEARHLVYIIRLAAFVVIIVGIVDKNRSLR